MSCAPPAAAIQPHPCHQKPLFLDRQGTCLCFLPTYKAIHLSAESHKFSMNTT